MSRATDAHSALVGREYSQQRTFARLRTGVVGLRAIRQCYLKNCTVVQDIDRTANVDYHPVWCRRDIFLARAVILEFVMMRVLFSPSSCRVNRRFPPEHQERKTLVESRPRYRPLAVRTLRDRAGEENFPVALRLLPERTRRHLLAVYAFARFVDDLGDEPAPGKDRRAVLAALDDVSADLDRIFSGLLPLEGALAPLTVAVRDCGLPREPFEALVWANRLDQTQTDYRTRDQLTDYCMLSAAPVGEVVLRVFGRPIDEPVRAASEQVCTALQLLEHWQDVGEDAARGRVYLPREDRDRFGVSPVDLRLSHAPPRLRALLAEETAWAIELLARGSRLVTATPGRARIAIAGYVAGGMATAAALARADFDPLGQDVRPRRRDVLAAASRLLMRPAIATTPVRLRRKDQT